MTAATTVAAALKATPWLTATLAATTVVLAGLNKVLDSHDSWVAFGSACSSPDCSRHSAGLLRGRPGLRISPALLGSRPASASARRSRNSIWAFVLRSSSAAHLARAS